MAKQGAKTVTPRLRFPEFREDAAWTGERLEELVNTVTPPAKLPSSSYQATGQFPIIDQSQEAICGWTDDAKALVNQPLPVIVFGDHTCALKFVERPFAQGADGIKILAARPAVAIEYLFHSLNHQPLVMEDYKRHFSVLKERCVFFPKIESGEQQKIADCLTSLDEVIAAQGRKVEALQAHKRGLMQQLFPREGETRPRLRFPEFRDAPEWTIVPLGKLLEGKPEYGVNAPAVPFSPNLPSYLRITDIDTDGRFVSAGKVSVGIDVTEENYLSIGDIALARTGASVGKSYFYREEDGRLVFAGFLIRIRPNRKKAVPSFVSSFLTTQQYWNWVQVTSARSGQPGINGSEYAALPIPIPPSGGNGEELAEQQRIADCLSSLDAQIAAESSRLTALKTHKQGLMQQLFPTPEAAHA